MTIKIRNVIHIASDVRQRKIDKRRRTIQGTIYPRDMFKVPIGRGKSRDQVPLLPKSAQPGPHSNRHVVQVRPFRSLRLLPVSAHLQSLHAANTCRRGFDEL